MSSKYGLLVANFVGIAQREPHQTSASCLERDDVFSARQHNPTDGDHVHFGNRIANDREGVLSNLAVGSDVVGGVDIAVVDLAARNELIDFDGPGAFDLHGIDLLVFDDEVLTLRDFEPAGRVLSGHNVASLGIDVLLFQSVAGFSVDPIEAHLFAESTTPDRGRSDKTPATAEGNPSNSHAGPCDTPQQHTSRSYTRNFTNCLGRRGSDR